MKVKKIILNKNITLIFCEKDEEGSMNAFSFEAKEDWTLKTDHGERFATRFTYKTQYAKDKGLYFSCANPKAAIQQAIIDVIGKSGKKLKDIYFKIVKEK